MDQFVHRNVNFVNNGSTNQRVSAHHCKIALLIINYFCYIHDKYKNCIYGNTVHLRVAHNTLILQIFHVDSSGSSLDLTAFVTASDDLNGGQNASFLDFIQFDGISSTAFSSSNATTTNVESAIVA